MKQGIQGNKPKSQLGYLPYRFLVNSIIPTTLRSTKRLIEARAVTIVHIHCGSAHGRVSGDSGYKQAHATK